MSRRRKADKREILPDPKFGDLVLSKFMACLMINGKKYCAEKIVYVTPLPRYPVTLLPVCLLPFARQVVRQQISRNIYVWYSDKKACVIFR